LPIFLEQEFAQIKNGVSDEKGGQYVDGIVQMSQKHNCGKEGGKTQEKITQFFIVPTHQGQKKRYARVPGKEEIVAGKNAVKNFFVEKWGTNQRMRGEWADVRETDKNRSDQSKDGNAF
jgi:hypothetical protein